MALGLTGKVWPMTRRGKPRAAPQELRPVLARNVRRLMDSSADLQTATALGKRSGVGRRTVDRLLKCERAATVDTLLAIAKAFGAYPWQLLVEDSLVQLVPPRQPPPEHVFRNREQVDTGQQAGQQDKDHRRFK